jgi:Ca-activated chloride channel family protein
VYNQPSRRRPLPLIIAVVLGLVAVVAVYLILWDDDGGGAQGEIHREGCVKFTMAASSEKAALLKQMANDYNSGTRTFGDGKCGDATVFSKASGGAMEALGSGWDEQRDGGPVPQVWSPASSTWISLLRERTTAQDKPDLVAKGELPSIAQTPLVLAMPRPMAEALGWPAKPIGWADVLGLVTKPEGWGAAGHPEWGRFKIGKTNPHFSTSGLNATIGAYVAATGTSTDLQLADLAKPNVVNFVKGVESGVVHYGDTTLTFLSNLADADKRGLGMSYISAVAVEEKSVWDYNQGNPTGDPALLGKNPKPQVPLVAIYPSEGTLLSDNPYAILTTASEEQNAAAADFLAFLQEKPQQDRFLAAAFRGYDGARGGPISQENGLLPDAKFTVLGAPAPEVTAKVLAGWDTQRKRANVLLVMDVSGSMNESTGSGSKLELAKRAAVAAVGAFAPDDNVALWTFSTELNGASTPWTERIPLGPVRANAAQLRSVIGSLAAEGGTALYATTRAAQRTMLASADPTRINAVVVLTDGRNEYPKDNDLEALVRDLDASQLENSVRVFTVAYGDRADLEALNRISQASRAAAYDARDPATIDKVLVAVLSNF